MGYARLAPFFGNNFGVLARIVSLEDGSVRDASSVGHDGFVYLAMLFGSTCSGSMVNGPGSKVAVQQSGLCPQVGSTKATRFAFGILASGFKGQGERDLDPT